MQADRIDLYRLFDTNVTYVAPLFQRPYVWTKSRNLEPLWQAALNVAEQRLAGTEPVQPHFMGAVVLNELSTATGTVPARELIDGQQRLTTLQVLLATLRDTAAERGMDDIRDAYADLVTNKARFAKSDQDTYKVWPTNADRASFVASMAPGGTGGEGTKIERARHYFASAVRLWLDAQDDEEVAMMALFDGMYHDLHLVAIDLDENDDAQLIFETLNALGTPLLPADLVKNYLFHGLADDEAQAVTLYQKHWSPYDEDQDFWRAEVRQGRLNVPRIDHYLKHYLTLKTRSDVSATQLFPAFKAFAEESPLSAAEHLETFRHYGDIYRRFSEFPITNREGTFFYRLGELDTTTVYPLLLEVFNGFGDDTNERRQILQDLESFLVRRAVCKLTPKNYNRLFLDALDQTADHFSADSIRRFLLTREGDSSRWPDDQEFEASWTHRALYNSLKRSRLRMVLEAVEGEARTGFTETVALPPRLTVEHVMPQRWATTWPKPKPTPGDKRSPQERVEARDHALNTIGNLTLVTGKLNPSMSNGSWAKKRSALRKHSALTLNREITEAESWNEESIEARGERLFGLASRIWPFPAAPDGNGGEIAGDSL